MSVERRAGDGQGSDLSAWMPQFCLSSWCRAQRWLVRPDARGRDLWLVAESLDMQPWSVAARDPVCPLCGEALMAHVEGVGDIETADAAPNPILRFIRTLDRAA